MDSTDNTFQKDLEKQHDGHSVSDSEAAHDTSVKERIEGDIRSESGAENASPVTDNPTPTEELQKDPVTKKQKKALRKISGASKKLEKSLARLERYQWLLDDLASRMRMVQANLKLYSNKKDRKMLKKELATEKSLLKSLNNKFKKTKKRALELQTTIDKLREKVPATE